MCSRTQGAADADLSIRVLFQVLMTLVRSMAPFTPMFCETLYLNLRHMLPEAERAKSVHFLPFPQPNLNAINERMELKVKRMQALIEKGRAARDKRGISLRTPVRAVQVCVCVCVCVLVCARVQFHVSVCMYGGVHVCNSWTLQRSHWHF